MAFSMKGGGSRMPLTYFKNVFFLVKNHLELSLTVKVCFAHSLGFIYVHIVVEVTMDMAEYTAVVVVVNFEPIIRGLKNDKFDWNQV